MSIHTPIAGRQKPRREIPLFRKVDRRQIAAIPGRKGLPVLGILPEAVRDPFSFTRRMYERFGPVHCFYACGNWNVQLVGPEANEFVLLDRERNFSAFGGWQPVFGRHFDGGLLLRDGADHQWHRKLIASAFKQERLQCYLRVFASNIERLFGRNAGRSVNLYEFAQQLTFANGYTGFLGREATSASRKDLLAFRYMMRSATAVLPWALPGTAHGRASWAKRHIAKLLDASFIEPVESRDDLASVLVVLHRQGLLSRSEVLSHLTFTIAASFDALSSGTVSTLYYLARSPEWQARVREELCAAIPSVGDAQLSDLQSCEQSDWAVKESLRLNAAAPVLWRRATSDFEFQGHSIPAGTLTGVNPMLTHLLPEVWSNPERFDPSRFAPELCRSRHRFAFVPFGSGAHGCLGANFASLQVRLLLRHVLEKYQLVIRDQREPGWYHWPNCRPSQPVSLEFVPLR